MAAHRSRMGVGICLMLLLPLCFGHQQSLASTAPVFVWGSGEHVRSVSGIEAAHTSYETVPVARVVDAVLGSVGGGSGKAAAQAGGSAASPRPDVVLVMLGTQLEVEALPKGGPLAPLQAMLRRASSSIALPFAQRRTDDGALYARVAEQLQAAQAGAKARGGDAVSPQLVELCGEAGDLAAAAGDAAAAAQPGKPVVLLMCSPPGGDLAAEVAALEGAVAAVEKSGRQYVAMYTADSAARPGRGRSLQQAWADEPDTQECDEKCRTQVRALEALILMLILLLAVAGGTFVMSAVDTPTRFEAPKKEHGGPMD